MKSSFLAHDKIAIFMRGKTVYTLLFLELYSSVETKDRLISQVISHLSSSMFL